MSLWRRWLKRRDVAPFVPNIGEDVRAYAIGDIHGRLDLLDRLLEMIGEDDARRTPAQLHLILLGDLIDRGPSSRQVVERIMHLSKASPAMHCLKGNHEEIFVLASRGDHQVVPLFRRMGGQSTLASYGLPADQFDTMSGEEVADWMVAHIPREHVDFIDACPDMLEIGDYLFVHAGIRPGVPIESQRDADLRWIRAEFLNHRRRHPRMVVHGHSISEDIDERPNRIGIDTGAYQSGRLTAVGLQREDRWFLEARD